MLKDKWNQLDRRRKTLWGLGGGIVLLGVIYLILTLTITLSERAVNIISILRISRSITILSGIVLILVLGFVYLGKIVIPTAALIAAGLISVILGGTSFELAISIFIPVAGCSLVGGLVGGFLRKGQKSQIVYSIFLSIAGALLGAVLIMSLMSM